MNDSRTLEDVRDAVIAAMDPKYDLIYVDYRDSLTDEQAAAVVRGDYESLWESTSEWEGDSLWEGAKYVMEELTKQVFSEWHAATETDEQDEWVSGLEVDWEHSNEWFEAMQSLTERDSGDWVLDLIRNTSDLYLRVCVGEDMYLSGDLDSDVETVMANISLTDTPALREVVRNILPEVGEGYVVPFVFGSGSVGDIHDLPMPWEPDNDVTLTGGSLLLENVYMGSGWNDDLPEGTSITVKRDELRTDEDAPGYSWDDVCGLVKGAWPMTIAPAVKHEAVSA